MAQESKQTTATGGSIKQPEAFWRQSKAAKEKNENRYYIEYEHAGIIKNLDGTYTELHDVLDPKVKEKTVFTKDGITYYIWTTTDDNTKQEKHLVQRVLASEYKPGGNWGGGGGGKYPQKRIIDSKLILQGIGLETLKALGVDGSEVDCKLVSEYLSGSKGWDWGAPGTSASDVIAFSFLDEVNGQLVIGYNVVKKEKKAGDSEDKKDEKK